MTSGGRFDFDDGGTYCGGWEDGKAHGFGVCTGPKGQGEFSGAWHCGFEISGIYTWTSGNNYRGQWTQGKRHGVGVETKGRWVYQGEWTQGFKGRYGVRHSSATGAKYEGTWTTGLQDGYGVETYADGGTYQGQWLRGIRHGYGVRQSVPYGLAAHCRQKPGRESLTSLRSEQEDDQTVKDRDRKIDENRGGFVLTGKRGDDLSTSDLKRRTGSADKTRSSLRKTITDGLKLRKQRSTGDIQDVAAKRNTASTAAGGSLRSTISSLSHGSFGSSQSGVMSIHTDSNASFVSQDDLEDMTLVESYSGEWKNDKRSGFGISERSDGLKYEGEWENNRKHGYGATTFRDGTREEGKYKNNVLISSGRRSKLFVLRSSKVKDRVDNAVIAAQRAAQIALQKADIAISRMASARSKADLALQAAVKAQSDADKARAKALEYAPDLFTPHPTHGSDAHKKDTLQPASSKSSLLMGNHITPGDALPHYAANQNHTGQHTAQASSAKALLSRVAKGVTGDAATAEPPPRQMAAIASALVSVGLDGSAHMVRNLASDSVSGSDTHQHSSPKNRQTEVLTSTSTGNPNSFSTPANTTLRTNNNFSTIDDESVSGTPVDTNRFSALLTPAIIDDHFDQYKTYTPQSTSVPRGTPLQRNPNSIRNGSQQGDATYGTNNLPEFSYERPQITQRYHAFNDPSPDSGVSVGDAEMGLSRGPLLLQRRKTLPGRQGLPGENPTPASSSGNPGVTVASERPKENGIGPAASGYLPATNVYIKNSGGEVGGGGRLNIRPTPLHTPAVTMFRSTLRKTPNMGSMPDVSEGATNTMPREEVHLLSLKRREEIRRQREEEERKRQQEIVLRFGDIKEWCQQRQLLVLVIAVNISLATMFFNLLAQ